MGITVYSLLWVMLNYGNYGIFLIMGMSKIKDAECCLVLRRRLRIYRARMLRKYVLGTVMSQSKHDP